jgi:hypothetical protein
MELSLTILKSDVSHVDTWREARHVIFMRNVVRTFAPHCVAAPAFGGQVSVRTMGAGFALVVRNTFAPRTSHNCGNNDNACVALVSPKAASVLTHCIVPAPIIRHAAQPVGSIPLATTAGA